MRPRRSGGYFPKPLPSTLIGMPAKLYHEGQLDERLKFTSVMKTKKGVKTVYIHDVQSDRNPEIQLCHQSEQKLRAPFGTSKFNKGAEGRDDLDWSIENNRLINVFKAVDDVVVAAAIENKATWFPEFDGKPDADDKIRRCTSHSSRTTMKNTRHCCTPNLLLKKPRSFSSTRATQRPPRKASTPISRKAPKVSPLYILYVFGSCLACLGSGQTIQELMQQ